MPEQGSEFQRRLPAVERRIADIQTGDMRVRLTGTVVDQKGEKLVLDDGSGKIEVTMAEPAEVKASIVRVFGKAVPTDGGFEVQGELVQDVSGLDAGLWKRVQELEAGK